MKLLLLGDVSPTDNTNPLFEAGAADELFNDTIELFDRNEYTFVNLECALTNTDTPIDKIGPPLKASPAVARVLASIGVDCCGMSNNHILDFGLCGIEDTKKALAEAKLAYTGFGDNYENSRKNHIIDKNGEKICLIAVCEHEYSYATETKPGSRPYDPYDTMEDIRNAKKEADRVIVLYHGGKEHCIYPSPRLRKLCRAMADNGADVVLTQHSHCIGCYENYDGGHILYGQGNFHFVKPEFSYTPGWDYSLAVEYDSAKNEIYFTPITRKGNGICLAKGDEAKRIMDDFEKANRELATGKWKDGWHNFCLEKKDFYMDILKKSFENTENGLPDEFFKHYIDCEAHFDVIYELCPTMRHTK